MKTIVVTGATGFIGNFVANRLEKEGYRIIRFGRKNRKDILYWDITKGTYKKNLAVDCVVHCAASVDDWTTYDESYAINVIGTKNVLDSFPMASEFIYISSASVYDPTCKHLVISEEDCVGGRLLNSYSRTKLLGEKEVLKSNIATRIILRPHIVYGPGDTTIGPRFKRAIQMGYFFVPGKGKNKISFTHVDNLALAISQSLKSSIKGLSVYNITDLEPIMLADAFNTVKKLNQLKFKEIYVPRKICFAVAAILELLYSLARTKRPPLLTRYLVEQMASDCILDISLAQRALHYNPSRTVKKDFLL